MKVHSPSDLDNCYMVRRKVFMEEQMISEEDEFDGLDSGSHHFLAFAERKPAAAARWRLTEKGVKLERFCTLKEYRHQGLANSLLKEMLEDVKKLHPGKQVYLYAQTAVKGLYEPHGFHEEGDEFMECDIPHQKMVLSEPE